MFTIKLASNFQTIEFQVEDLNDGIIDKAIDKVNDLGNQVINTSAQKASVDMKLQARKYGYLASEKQLNLITALGGTSYPGMTKDKASKIINELMRKTAEEDD